MELDSLWLPLLGRKAQLKGDHNAASGQQLQLVETGHHIRSSGGWADTRRERNDIVIVEEVVDAQLDLRLVEVRSPSNGVVDEKVVHPEGIQLCRLMDATIVHPAGADLLVQETNIPCLVLVGKPAPTV